MSSPTEKTSEEDSKNIDTTPQSKTIPKIVVHGSVSTSISDAGGKRSSAWAQSSGPTRKSSYVQALVPTRKYKSFMVEELPPCQTYRTRSSIDHLTYPIDRPKAAQKYNPPFRRNFRYFGYPQNLNLEINTPPRVKSWGSIPDITVKSNNRKRQIPSSYGFQVKKDASFDPHWMGRLLKNNLLLKNPGLIPATDKAAVGLGSKDKLKLIHPEFEVHNCPSDLYFPITDKSRKAFCKINKAVQAKIDEQVHAYTVQNPTAMKFVAMEQVTLQDEKERYSKELEMPLGRRSTQTYRQSIFTAAEERVTSFEEKLFYEHSNHPISPIIKTMCIDKNWPGMSRQLYQRPKESEDRKEDDEKKTDTFLRYGVVRIPDFPNSNMPVGLWEKLAKIRQRQQQLTKTLQARGEGKNFNDKFKTFTQQELRDTVMKRARNEFIKNLKEDLDAPLPPELFQDNRDHVQPYHDFEGKGEFPAQGPFWWKIRKEPPPSQEELDIVEKSIEEARTHHSFTHHLPGLLYSARHPFQPLELDWMDKGSEMGVVRERRKTPSTIQEMPSYMMHLDKEGFEEKFLQVVKEGAKDLVGPEIYEMYKKTYGVVEKVEVEEKQSTEEIPEVATVPVKKIRSAKVSKSKVARVKIEEEEEDDEHEVEDEGKEDEEEEEGQQIEIATPEVEPHYAVSLDLLDDEEFPLPDTRFSAIEFPKDKIPEGLKDDLKFFKKDIEKSEPVRPDEEERIAGDNSDTPTDTDEEKKDLRFSHDPVSHLQVMYQDAVKERHKSFHRPGKAKDLDPPNLRDIFLMETYTDDIDHLLYHSEDIPKFLQLF